MKRILTSRILLYAAILFFAASCSSISKDSYVSLIPKDVAQIISVDAKSLSQKAELGNSENDKYRDELIKRVSSGASEPTAKLVSDIVKDPYVSGIDFNAPLYIFVSGGELNTPALVAKMGDKVKFETLIDQLVSEETIKERVTGEEYSYGESTDGDAAIFYNDESILICSNYVKSDDNGAIKIGEKLFAESKTSSIYDNSGFEKMVALSGDVKFLTSLSSLPKDVKSQLEMNMNINGIDVSSMVNLMVAGSARFDKGEVNLDVITLSEDAKTQALLDEGLALMKKMNGDLLKMCPSNALAVIALRIDGETICKKIEESPDFAKLSESNKADYQAIANFIKSIDGDFLLSPVEFNNISDFTLIAYAQMNSSAAAALEALYNDPKINSKKMFAKKGDNKYAFETPFVNIYFGIEDGLFYITNKSDLKVGEKASPSIADSFKSASGKAAFFAVNGKEVLELCEQMRLTRSIPRELRVPITEIKTLESSIDTDGVFNLKICLNNSEANSLKVVVSYLKERLN